MSSKCTQEKLCYNCGEPGHEKAQCQAANHEEKEVYEVDELDEINSPEYSPIKTSNEEECWSDEKIADTIKSENVKDLFTRDELAQIMNKISSGAGIKDESRRLTEAMEPRKATDTFIHHMRELNEITINKSLNPEDRKKLKIEKHRWIYGSLIIMKKENIAGIYRRKMIRFEEKEKETRKRNSEAFSPQDQNKKNAKY